MVKSSLDEWLAKSSIGDKLLALHAPKILRAQGKDPSYCTDELKEEIRDSMTEASWYFMERMET